MIGKRGQGLSVEAIVLIVLAVVLLVVLILGFTVGWNKFLPFLSSNNVQTIVNTCNLACSQGSQFDFCSAPRTLNDGENDPIEDITCYNLATDYPVYGVADCDSITCPVVEEE
jgi:hypothetical protein